MLGDKRISLCILVVCPLIILIPINLERLRYEFTEGPYWSLRNCWEELFTRMCNRLTLYL